MNALIHQTANPSHPNSGVNGVALTVLIVLFLLVTVMGGHIFDAVNAKSAAAAKTPTGPQFPVNVPKPAQWTYITLAFGSAMALFMYPHSITAVLSSKSRLRVPSHSVSATSPTHSSWCRSSSRTSSPAGSPVWISQKS